MFRIGSLKRTIYPVGQGAFYVEQIITKSHRTIVVCDCGSSSEFKCMDKCIRDFCLEIRGSDIDC